ncbi:MAG: type II secretion system protein M [Candidatus Thiodiazotropha sp. (ex Notomyrtea botanica)]|nr:type II secretion system protein M [Candidatus Thiodiazotropha sp. (ex Notomyrtea botanica)]
MISRLTRNQSKSFAVILLLLTLALLVTVIALPVWSMNRHYDDQISSMTNQLETYRRVAMHGDQYQSEFQRLVKSQRNDRRYLQSATESLATAELQRKVKQLIAGKQGNILSTQVLQTTEEEGFSRVVIRVRMKSTLEDMLSIFHSLESQKPYLFISDLTIRSRQVARRRLPATKELNKALRLLDIDFQLSGYMRGEKS